MMENDGFIGLTAICGEEGTCKTSMALSFPRPLSHLDIDVGGYARASWRIDTEGIESHSFPKPLTDADIAKMKGGEYKQEASSRAIGVPKKIEGMKELWQTIIDQIVKDALDSSLHTIVIDSATMHYKIGCDAYLQELQEKQLYRWKNDQQTKNRPWNDSEYREKLQPMEYGVVYDRLQRIYHTCRSYRKNLVLVHYPTDEYGTIADGKGGFTEGKTGKIIMDGYKETAKFCDLIVWTELRENMVDGKKDTYPVAKITKCGIEGMGLRAKGMEIMANYDAIINLRNMLRGTTE